MLENLYQRLDKIGLGADSTALNKVNFETKNLFQKITDADIKNTTKADKDETMRMIYVGEARDHADKSEMRPDNLYFSWCVVVRPKDPNTGEAMSEEALAKESVANGQKKSVLQHPCFIKFVFFSQDKAIKAAVEQSHQVDSCVTGNKRSYFFPGHIYEQIRDALEQYTVDGTRYFKPEMSSEFMDVMLNFSNHAKTPSNTFQVETDPLAMWLAQKIAEWLTPEKIVSDKGWFTWLSTGIMATSKQFLLTVFSCSLKTYVWLMNHPIFATMILSMSYLIRAIVCMSMFGFTNDAKMFQKTVKRMIKEQLGPDFENTWYGTLISFCIHRLECMLTHNTVGIAACLIKDTWTDVKNSWTSYMRPSNLRGFPSWLMESFQHTITSLLGTFFPWLPFVREMSDNVGNLLVQETLGAHASLTMCISILTILPRSVSIMVITWLCKGTGIEGWLKEIGPSDDPVEMIVNIAMDSMQALQTVAIFLKAFQEMYSWIVDVFPCVWDWLLNGKTFKNSQEIAIQSKEEIFESACCMKDFLSKFGVLYSSVARVDNTTTYNVLDAVKKSYATNTDMVIQHVDNDTFINPETFKNKKFTDGTDIYEMKWGWSQGYYPVKIVDTKQIDTIKASGSLQTVKFATMDKLVDLHSKYEKLYTKDLWNGIGYWGGVGMTIGSMAYGLGSTGTLTTAATYAGTALAGATAAISAPVAIPLAGVAIGSAAVYNFSDPRLKDFVSERPIFRVSYYARRSSKKMPKRRLYINFYMFRWKKTVFLHKFDSDVHIGVNADEFEYHFPSCVRRNPIHGYKQIFLCRFIPRHLKEVIRNCYHFKPQSSNVYSIERLRKRLRTQP